MEIDSGARVQNPAPSATAAKVAAGPGPNVAAKLPTIEIKAPPEVKKFEGPDLDQAVADLQRYVDGLDRVYLLGGMKALIARLLPCETRTLTSWCDKYPLKRWSKLRVSSSRI